MMLVVWAICFYIITKMIQTWVECKYVPVQILTGITSILALLGWFASWNFFSNHNLY
jgi:hypothetical protein